MPGYVSKITERKYLAVEISISISCLPSDIHLIHSLRRKRFLRFIIMNCIGGMDVLE